MTVVVVRSNDNDKVKTNINKNKNNNNDDDDDYDDDDSNNNNNDNDHTPWQKSKILSLLAAPRTVSNTYTQVARTRRCATLLSLITYIMPCATLHYGTAQLSSLFYSILF